MGAGVVSVGRQRYAVGLYWENSPGSGRVAQIAKEAAGQAGQQADFFAVRSGNKNGRIPQFGLSNIEAGHAPSMPVLAACLANQIPGSWAGAFRLNEGIALVVVRDDLIVPDGDQLFLDESEARDRLIQEVGFGGLQATYAPEAWSIPGADSIPITLLLGERHDIKLQPVQIPRNVKIATAGAVLAIILIIGAVWVWRAQEEAAELARMQQEEALRRAREAVKPLLPNALTQAPEPVYDRKWEKEPVALDVVKTCREGLSDIPTAWGGWKMSSLKCAGPSVVVTWNRLKSFSTPPPNSIVNDSANSATQTFILPGLTPRGSETLADPDVITSRYLNQDWPGTISRAQDDPPPPPPPGYEKNWNPPPAPWVKRSFTLHVSILPAELPGLLDRLPGVIITSMSFMPGGATAGAWTVEGVIYENRK